MHRFLIRDGVGFERKFGFGSCAAAELARKTVGADAVVAVLGDDTYWFRPQDAAEFSRLLGQPLVAVNTAAGMLKAKAAKKEVAQQRHNEWAINKAGPNARRVRHVKFGAGTVVAEDASAVTVLFDGQKKPLRLVPSAVEGATE